MPDIKTSEFPAVLKEYLPEYELPTARTPRQPVPTENLGRKQSQGGQQDGHAHKPQGGHHEKKQHGKVETTEKKTRPISRDSTFAEPSWVRFDRTYSHWQAAKVDLRESDAKRLKQKVALQHELIQAQDELLQQKRELHEKREKKRRETEKLNRQAKLDALLSKGKESFENERQDRLSRRTKSPPKVNSTTTRSSPSHYHRSEHLYSPADTHLSRRYSGYSVRSAMTSPTHAHHDHPSKVAEEVEPDDTIRRELTEEEIDQLPWHHAQLYKIYGAEVAEDIIHPKEVKQRPINPKLRREGGRSGAEALFNVLRTDTKRKLAVADNKIPQELKDSYSAFVRQGVGQGRKPVERFFCAKKDIPDMDRLLDQSLLNSTREYHHRLGIMFRASHSNEDRTNVLNFNNPIPDLNNINGEESIGRYLPSWAGNDWDKESELSYKKWLERAEFEKEQQLALMSRESKQLEGIPERDENGVLPDEEPPQLLPILGENSFEDDEWAFLKSKKKDRKNRGSYQGPKVQFLTEAQARTPGQFSKKYKELEKQRDMPVGHERPDQPQAQSVMEFSSQDSSRYTSQKSRSQTAPPMTDAYLKRYSSSWEPIDMNALMEYTEYMKSIGDGDFRHGRTKMYTVA